MTHIDNETLIWDTEGYYTFGSDSWKDINITARMKYNGGLIGIIPRFDSDISYVLFSIGNQTTDSLEGSVGLATCRATLSAYISTQVIHLDEKELPAALAVGQDYILKSVISRTNYKIYLDNVMVFNLEYNGLNNGMGGLFSTQGNSALEVSVESSLPKDWVTNVVNQSGAMIELREFSNKDQYVYLDNQSADKVYLKQLITRDETEPYPYTLAYDINGDAEILVVETNGSNPKSTSILVSNTKWERLSSSIPVSLNTTELEVIFIVSPTKNVSINNVQFEKSEFPTTYIHNEDILNTRGRSFVTYPSKNNIVESVGAISMWINPLANNKAATLFEYGESSYISLSYTGTDFNFVYGESLLSYTVALPKDTWCHVVASWRSDVLKLYIDGVKTEINGLYEFSGRSDIIRIGHSKSELDIDTFNGVIDDVIIFSKDVDDEYVAGIIASTDAIPTDDQMILRATFDYAIGNFNRSIIEMSPAPNYGAPVIVEKEDGTIMRKVSFFDKYTGEYMTHNEEEVIYDGVSDYVTVAYDDLDETSFKISIRDYVGALQGDPYTVKGNRVYLTLTAEQKKSLKGRRLWVTYQPENAYTVDFNINQPDSFRTTIGKYDGQPLTVTYEGNRFANEKLGEMVELNPLLNPNHQGFLYVTKNTELTSVFRVKATPSDLPADGVAEAIVVIEPLDSNGNFISNAKLEVVTEMSDSSIIPNYDPGSIMVRERAGRYLYRYRVPLMYFSDHEAKQATDYINIRDKKSGIGVQIPINLSLADEYYNSDTGPTLEESNWELVASRLLNVIMDYFNMNVSSLPEGLGDILDFDADGVIDLKEIIWLNDHKFTQDLYTKYVEYLSWQVLNQ